MTAKKEILTLAIGSALLASTSSATAMAVSDNPFELKTLSSGYMLAEADSALSNNDKSMDKDKMKDGKCSSNMDKSKDKKSMKENAGADSKLKDGKCSADKK